MPKDLSRFKENPPESICLLRLSAIGDVTHALPIVHTLQKVWPKTRITWVIGKLEASLVGDLPGVRFITFDKSRGYKAYFDLRKKMANETFDILLHMQVAVRASLASLWIKAPIKLGFDKARARDNQSLFTNARIAAKPNQHVLDGFFCFLEALGIEKKEMCWDIPVPHQALQFAEEQLPGDQPIMVINPCSSNRSKNWRNWSISNYADLADYAAQTYGYRVVLTGGPDKMEIDYGQQIAETSESPIINLIGKTSLKQLIAVLSRASLTISPDTGPAHMSVAAGTPVIGLYASSNPERTGPYNYLDLVVNRYPQALEHFDNRKESEVKWGQRVRDPKVMDQISLEDVKAQLDRFQAGEWRTSAPCDPPEKP